MITILPTGTNLNIYERSAIMPSIILPPSAIMPSLSFLFRNRQSPFYSYNNIKVVTRDVTIVFIISHPEFMHQFEYFKFLSKIQKSLSPKYTIKLLFFLA